MEITTPEADEPVTLEMIYNKLESMKVRQGVDSLKSWIFFSSSLSITFAALSVADEARQFWWVIFSSFYLALAATSVMLYRTGIREVLEQEKKSEGV